MATAQQQRSLGAYGERVAARYLTDCGMTVLDRNWRCPAGEIDLVLRDGDVLVICEVKTRRGIEFGHPVAAVSAAKVERLHRLAMLWVEHRVIVVAEIRLDIVGIVLPTRGLAQIEHVSGVE
jgi:putative endonuclease